MWENETYSQWFAFETDVAFEVAARVIVGTFQHGFKDGLGVNLLLEPAHRH